MSVRQLLALSVCVALTGCSVSIPVVKLSGDQANAAMAAKKGVGPNENGALQKKMAADPTREGTLLILPRTAIDVKFNTVATKFAPGRWTSEVKACSDHETSSKESCLRLRALEVKSKKPKDDCGLELPAFSIDPKSFAFTPNAQPDPAEIYWVSTPATWLRDSDVTVKYSETGTVAGATMIATNPWADFASKTLGAGIKAFGAAAGGGPRKTKAPGVKAAPECEILPKNDCVEFLADLDALALFNTEKFQAMGVSAGPNFEQQVAYFDKRFATQLGKFEGVLTKTLSPKNVQFLPVLEKIPVAEGEQPDIFQVKVIDSPALGEHLPDLGPDVPCGNDTWCSNGRFYLNSCPQTAEGTSDASGAPADKSTWSSQVVRLVATFPPETAKIRTTLKPILDKSVGGFGRIERGLPYRVPGIASISVVLYDCKNTMGEKTTCEKKDETAPTRAAVAQLGSVGRLTPRAGGKKATMTVDYYGDTGALKTVQVAGVGADSKEITDALQERLAKKPETTEIDKLKEEKARLETLAGICTAYAKLSAEPPEYCSE